MAEKLSDNSNLITHCRNTLKSVISKWQNNPHISTNISWLFFDKALRLIVGLGVSSWVARYLGPDQYGVLNYATALVALFGSLITLGVDNIVIRHIIAKPEERNRFLGSAFLRTHVMQFILYALHLQH